MKKYLIIAFILILCGTGCLTAETYRTSYSRIKYSDGVDREEAMVIAQMDLSRTQKKSDFKIKYPRVMRNHLVKKHVDYWFIAFEAKKFNDAFWEYLVVVHKGGGRVVFSKPHVPLDYTDYDWIFQE